MRRVWVVALAAGCGLSQPAPVLRAVSPGAICAASPVTLTLDGDDFVALPSGILRAQTIALPTVTLDGPMQIVLADDAAAATGPVSYVSSHQLTVQIDAAPAGRYTVTVTNPDGQVSVQADALTATDSPMLTMISPDKICQDSGGTLMLTGTGFAAGATVKLVDPTSGMSLDGTLSVTSPTRADATFPPVPFGKNQDVNLVVTNPDGCAGTIKVQIKPGAGAC